MLALLFVTFSHQTHLPEDLLSSLCYVESKHKITAVHHDDGHSDSLGVCQIKLSTAKSLGFQGTAKDLMKPEANIKYAAIYLRKQIDRYSSISKGVIAYNRGNSKSLTTTRYQRRVFREWRKEYLNAETK